MAVWLSRREVAEVGTILTPIKCVYYTTNACIDKVNQTYFDLWSEGRRWQIALGWQGEELPSVINHLLLVFAGK